MHAPARRSSATVSPELSGAPASVYVALGSNLGDRLATLQAAARELQGGVVPGTTLVRGSPVFETRPLGPSTWAYLNAVVELHTVAEPHALLAALQALEQRHGRVRRDRWEARTLDLDILVWLRALVPGAPARVGLEVNTPGLRLPHPELERRDFVLAPLATLAPDLRPGGGTKTVAQLLAALGPGDRTIVAQVAGLLC